MRNRKLAKRILTAVMVLSLSACGTVWADEDAENAAANDTGELTMAEAAAAVEGEWDQEAEFASAIESMDLSGVVSDCEEKDLTMSTHVSETDSSFLYCLAFKEAVETLSGGAMTVELYSNSQLYGQAEALQAVQQGTLDIANSDTTLLANYNPAASVLDMPCFLKSRNQAVALTSDPDVMGFINDAIGDSNMHLLSVVPMDFRNALCKDMDIDSVDDFKGFILRVPEAPHTIAAFEAIGATATVIPSSEAYTSVQTGVADGLEGNAEYIYLSKFYEVAKNLVQTHHIFSFLDFVMGKEAYEALTDNQKAVIDAAAEQAHGAFLHYTERLFPAMYKALQDEGVVFTEIDRQALVDATEEYRNNYITENGLEEVVEKINSIG